MASGSSGLPLQLNTWEDHALDYQFPAQPAAPVESENTTASSWIRLQDPVIYPGIYSSSGVDVMGILLRVASRPAPCLNLGPLDCSVALTICDLSAPDAPIVYASPGFCQLTGYSSHEIMGRNCRFLQRPPHILQANGYWTSESHDSVAKMGYAIRANQEIRLEVINYKRDGRPFTNLVTILPLWPDATGHHYAIGFQAEV